MSTNGVPSIPARRILSIDGCGLGGIIPAQALMEIERQLDVLTGDPQPLCSRFDLIGGTSTGAILAVGLGLGMKAEKLRDFYVKFGEEIFRKAFWPERFRNRYPNGPIEKRLKQLIGENIPLGARNLRTLILLMVKNATLGSDWFFTNNPHSRFFGTNSKIPLWQIVRGSTATPTYFPPHPCNIPDGAGKTRTYDFIDGGMSSCNNPALQVFLEATVPSYGIGWPMGADNLLLMSIGSGYAPVTIPEGEAAHYNLLSWERYVMKELMNESTVEQSILMRLIGEKPAGAAATAKAPSACSGMPGEPALAHVSAGLGARKLVTYQRITVELTRQKLNQLNLPNVDPARVREMDAVDQIDNLRKVGEAMASEQVRMDRLIRFFP